MKKEITNKNIREVLLQHNDFGCLLYFSFLAVPLFVGLEIGAVYLF